MRKVGKKLTALALAASMAVTTLLTGCGSSSSGTDAESGDDFTFLISNSDGSTFFEEYEDKPVVQYWMDMFDINVDFTAPASGTESDVFNTLLATGEYADVMSMAYSSESALELYDEGIALDITDYVDQYMPNYKALCEELGITDYVTNNVDGEKKYIQLYDICDAVSQMWGGYEYRRDWIVKYGTNPETGEAFSGAWSTDEDGNDVWTDDVVFPSGNTDPIYISDWEWMFEIFEKAMADQGITDGYCISIPYAGFSGTNDLASMFGEGAVWYMDSDGVCQFGGDSDSFRTMLKCFNTWYENGWIDQTFDERSSDIFFSIDTASVYSGKVGMWYGLNSQLGKSMDAGNGDASNYTNGIVVFGAAQPINDVYGDEEFRNIEPFAYYATDIINTSMCITDKAKDKDLEKLFTALDYLYSEEGGYLRNYGFSDEQQKEVNDDFYNEHDLQDGAYSTYTAEDGTLMRLLNKNLGKEDGVQAAANMMRVLGRTPIKTLDSGNPSWYEHSVNQWTMYNNSGNIPGTITSQLSKEAADEDSTIFNDVYYSYMCIECPKFVTGEKDIDNDADWQEYLDGLVPLNPDKYCDNINAVNGK